MTSHRPGPASPAEVSKTLMAARTGDAVAGKRLVELLYEELLTLARNRMGSQSPGQTLQATALVHEAYMRVAEKGEDWDGRGHFFFAAARAMRDIQVEQARRKRRLKHGGGHQRVELGEIEIEAPAVDTLLLDEALQRLEQEHPDHLELVMLRYFAGLSFAEIAELTAVSMSTVERRWRFVRAWLRRELDDEGGQDES